MILNQLNLKLLTMPMHREDLNNKRRHRKQLKIMLEWVPTILHVLSLATI